MLIRLAVSLILGLCLHGADAPDWLREASTVSLPQYPAKTPAAVVLQEEAVTIDPNGKQLRTTRYAIKVLNREGIRKAKFADYYFSDTGKPRDLRAWLISPSGKTKEYSKSDIQDTSMMGGLYDEVRARSVNAESAADPGSFFGVESTMEQTQVFSQFQYDFQDDLPAVRSSFVLNIPAGWRAEGKVFYGSKIDAIEPQISGNSYRWQMVKLDPWERESSSPIRPPSRPRLVVNLIPPAGTQTPIEYFNSWKDVSVWKNQLAAKSAEATPEITAYVQSIAPKTLAEAARIQKLAEAAQNIRYISVQMNLSRGGGYTPHSAEFVHQKKYGDCKDKSNYLRTLLKVAGIDSYMVSIFSGDPAYSRPEWPSPHQFNHAILAIRVSDQFQAAAALNYPGIGRIVLFDPTDEDVPFGFIPDHEQGSYALLVSAEHGNIFQTPQAPPSANHLTRKTTFSLTKEGGIKAVIAETSTGQTAFDARYLLRRRSAAEYLKSKERYIGYVVPGSALEKLDHQDGSTKFESSFTFSTSVYARMMQDRLMMVRPLPLPTPGLPDTTNPKRTQPLVLNPSSFSEEATLELPVEFEIDELPEYPDLVTDFAKYTISIVPQGQKILIRRSLEIQAVTIPPENYSQLREFIGKITGSERTPIVLTKK